MLEFKDNERSQMNKKGHRSRASFIQFFNKINQRSSKNQRLTSKFKQSITIEQDPIINSPLKTDKLSTRINPKKTQKNQKKFQTKNLSKIKTFEVEPHTNNEHTDKAQTFQYPSFLEAHSNKIFSLKKIPLVFKQKKLTLIREIINSETPIIPIEDM
jgi:hypothetical protein